MKILKFLLDLFFLTRPVVLVPVWGFALFGLRLSVAEPVEAVEAFAQILFFSLSVASVYVLNQIADRKVDEANGGFPLLVKTNISNKTAMIWAIILAVMSIVLPVLSGFPKIAVLSFLSLLVGFFYCFAPFSFSGRPVLDFLSNALGYGTIAFAAGWILGGGEINLGFIRAMLPYFFMMAGGSISSTLPDFDGDKANGKNTTAVHFGKKTAHFIALGCIIASIVGAYYQSDFVAFSASAVAVVFYILYALNWQSQKLMEACYKVGGGISMLIIGVFYPILLISGAVIVLASILYFRIFYGVSYPSLLPAEGSENV